MVTASNIAFAVAGVLAILYLAYRWALPKPLPGIPYNEEATESILGDLPSLIRALKNGSDIPKWMRDQNRKANSPINQVFVQPLRGPTVMISDYRETRDIMVNRMHDFDRATFVSDLFRPVLNCAQITLPTGPTWKKTRRIGQDAMSPKFLREAVAPNISKGCSNFIDLWTLKADLAQGHAFDAEHDMFHAALDGVLQFTYGENYPYSATKPKVESLTGLSKGDINVPADPNAPVEFPHVDIAEELNGLIHLADVMEEVQSTGIPLLAWKFKTRTSRYKRLVKLKRHGIRRQVTQGIERYQQVQSGDVQDQARNAVDLIISKEAALAAKENRAPNYYSESIESEIHGFIVGGHDTTSGTMCWAFRLLADNQEKQFRLRQALQEGLAAAKQENRMPTSDEILSTPIPYLDATIEELFRLGAVVPANNRTAIRDTEVFGHMIPKGTNLVYLTNGASMLDPPYKVPEHLRSESSQKDEKAGKVKAWMEDDDMSLFQPERWLVKSDEKNNSATFDPAAGPSLGFGLGMRGCFGRRLAYVSLRILVVSIIWNFELLECPKDLASYDASFGIVYKPKKTYVRLRKIDLTKNT